MPGGPALLLAAQSTALAATAPLLFAVARAGGARAAVAAAIAIVWLASPLTHSANLFDFHPETFVPALLAAGALGLERERTSLVLVSAVAACSLKEDVSLVYLAWGLLLTASARRRLGLAVAVGAAAWFVLATRVGVVAFGGSLDYYSHRFGGGNSTSVGSVARELVLSPATGVARGIYAQPGPDGGRAASARRAALALVPPQAAVAAQFDVVAQLARRRLVYVLPQPFVFLPHDGDTWSRRELARRSTSVRWVLLDDGSSYPGEPGQLARVRRRLPALGFRTVFARDGVTLLRRRSSRAARRS